MIQKVSSQPDVLLRKNEAVFQEGLCKMHHFKVSLHLNNNAVPCFHRPRPVLFALREVVGQEFDRMEKKRVLEHMRHGQWTPPIDLRSLLTLFYKLTSAHY